MLRSIGEPRLVTAAWATPGSGTRRAMPINLVIVFAFALMALALLARVLVSAAQIDNNVTAGLNPAILAVESDTSLLERLDETVVATDQMVDSVSQFDSDLGTTATATDRMRSLGRTTDQSVDGIEGSVVEIGTSVVGIKKSVTSLESSVRGIRGNTVSIARQFDGTHGQTAWIVKDLAASNSHVARILTVLDNLDPVLARLNKNLASLARHTKNMAENGLIELGNLLPDLLSGKLLRSNLLSLDLGHPRTPGDDAGDSR